MDVPDSISNTPTSRQGSAAQPNTPASKLSRWLAPVVSNDPIPPITLPLNMNEELGKHASQVLDKLVDEVAALAASTQSPGQPPSQPPPQPPPHL